MSQKISAAAQSPAAIEETQTKFDQAVLCLTHLHPNNVENALLVRACQYVNCKYPTDEVKFLQSLVIEISHFLYGDQSETATLTFVIFPQNPERRSMNNNFKRHNLSSRFSRIPDHVKPASSCL